jgi:hypothetical protein
MLCCMYTGSGPIFRQLTTTKKADNVSTYDPGGVSFSTIAKVSEINLRERVRLHRVIHSKAFDEDIEAENKWTGNDGV